MVGLSTTLIFPACVWQAPKALYMKDIKRDAARTKTGNPRIKICNTDIICGIQAYMNYAAASAKES